MNIIIYYIFVYITSILSYDKITKNIAYKYKTNTEETKITINMF